MPQTAAAGYEPGRREVHGPAFGRTNYILMGVAAGVIALGFISLGTGSITLAPVLLVLGYLVLVPLAILKR